MVDESQKDKNLQKKSGDYGSSQGTQEREERITGSSGVQNKQGQNINQGSTTGQKGGPGMGQQRQGNLPQSERQSSFGKEESEEEKE